MDEAPGGPARDGMRLPLPQRVWKEDVMGVGIDGKRETRRGTGRVLMDFVEMQVSVDDRPDREEAGQKTRTQQAHPQFSRRHLHGRAPMRR